MALHCWAPVAIGYDIALWIASPVSGKEITMVKLALCIAAILLMGPAEAQPASGTVSIVAAENFYGDVAQQMAGPNATVTSILSNPDQDPHLFEASPSVARTISTAAIVVYNGADYDPWMAKLLNATRSSNRKIIIVAKLVNRKAGDNPHLWYDPATMPVFAKALATALSERDPGHKADYDQRLQAFLTSLQPIQAKIADLRGKFAGSPVTATEPVVGYLVAALGLKMRNERFQLAVMNDTEPRASDVVSFENDLRKRRVRLLFFNSQASDAAAQRMVRVAQESRIPVVGVTETEPSGTAFQDWMMGELDAIAQALSTPP
jgi:zinc/manganese transport system substrate-binding protein